MKKKTREKLEQEQKMIGRPLTEQEIKAQERKLRLYDYYGIPYGKLDGCSSESDLTKDDFIHMKAEMLILKEEEIPKDLEEKLLKIKEKAKHKNKGGTN